MSDALGDRMKAYEGAETERRFMPYLPIMARVDGRAFHNFTRGMRKPFDEDLRECMVRTAIALVEETNASLAYTQSDEISLAWHIIEPGSEVWFGRRIMKMATSLAASATGAFIEAVAQIMPTYLSRRPRFDARMWQVPNRVEGANAIMWREWDATKNSISMAASAHYSPAALEGKNGLQRLQMLQQKGVNWEQYPDVIKRGTYIQRRIVERPFTAEELERLPAKHEARRNPNLVVRRSTVGVVAMPPFVQLANREAVVFEGAAPILLPEFQSMSNAA